MRKATAPAFSAAIVRRRYFGVALKHAQVMVVGRGGGDWW